MPLLFCVIQAQAESNQPLLYQLYDKSKANVNAGHFTRRISYRSFSKKTQMKQKVISLHHYIESVDKLILFRFIYQITNQV